MPGNRGRHSKKVGGGRATPKGTKPSSHTSAHVRAIFADAAEVVGDDPIEAEAFASSFQQVFRSHGSVRQSLATTDEVLREALRVGGVVGLFVARSIGLYGPHAARNRAGSVYDKVATKTPPPRWLVAMGNVTVGDAVMLRDQYGDGYGLYLEYDDQSGTRSIGVYIDANMGAIAKDIIDGPPLSLIREMVVAEPQIEIVPVDHAEARARVEAAFSQLDELDDYELSEDLDDLRALAEHRFSLLPSGGSVPVETHELSDAERDALIEAFVSSRHFFGLPNEAREIGESICDFADEGDGDPLRWSPVVVEIFLTGWVPSEIVADDEYYRDIPIVLRSWIRFAGERRGLQADLIDETVQSVDQWLDEYYDLVRSPDVRGPAQQLVDALTLAGVDLDDNDAVQSFIDDYNAGLADVDIDLDRADEGLLAQWRAFETQLVDVMRSSLPALRGVEQPTALVEASAEAVRAGIRESVSPFAEAASVADLGPDELDRIGDLDLVSSIATAWFEPVPDMRDGHQLEISDDELAQAASLEHTDLLRVIVILATEGPGSPASANTLAKLVDIDDPDDRDLVRGAFANFVTVWQAMGVVDASARLTALGHWLLPRAFARRWGGDFDE
jgi:hypothetical protein